MRKIDMAKYVTMVLYNKDFLPADDNHHVKAYMRWKKDRLEFAYNQAKQVMLARRKEI